MNLFKMCSRRLKILTDNIQLVSNYLNANRNKPSTAEDVAKATGLTKRQVDGVFTMAFQRKGLGRRVLAQVIDENGMYVNVKYLVLNK